MTEDELKRICSKDAEIALIGEKVSSIKEDVTEMKEEFKLIRNKPAETLKWLVTLVGGAIVTACVALILHTIGLV